MALGAAAIDDVSAWWLLAFLVGIAGASVSRALLVLALAAAFIAFMLCGVRPLLARCPRFRTPGPFSPGLASWVLLGVLASALATETIGVHALFGAFLFGALIPHDSPVARRFHEHLDQLVASLLLPAFFAFVGMRTEIGLLAGPGHWLTCGLIIVTACAGKFGGAFLAARAVGVNRKDAAALGALMNTRGLMELIVLNVGLEMGVVSPTLFAMMVLMTLATTLAAGPVLALLRIDAPNLLAGVQKAAPD
jgi:Kef-type K+ transport system membrane component KefB